MRFVYLAARKLVSGACLKFDRLYTIYQKDSYYSGFYLWNITYNIRLNGSVSVEVNHSSVLSHLGTSGSWKITENRVKLMERQQDHYNQKYMLLRTMPSSWHHKYPIHNTVQCSESICRIIFSQYNRNILRYNRTESHRRTDHQ